MVHFRYIGTLSICLPKQYTCAKFPEIYCGVNLRGKNVSGNLFFAGTYICGLLKTLKKLEPAKKCGTW